MNTRTIKQILPDIQLFLTSNKTEIFYFGIVKTYPELSTFIKVTRTNKGYDLKEVDKMHNINFTCCLGYHHDYLTGDQWNVINKYLEDNYLAKNLINDCFEKAFNSDDIPF